MKKKEFVISGSNGKSILIDVTYIENKCPKKVVIFCHGFKGFKDWGAFNKIAEYFAKENLFFLKFNFSHNGTTLEKPSDFDDMEAFGNNNFCIELDDLNNPLHPDPTAFITQDQTVTSNQTSTNNFPSSFNQTFHENNTYLDIGSTLNPYLTETNRGYLRGGNTQLKTCIW